MAGWVKIHREIMSSTTFQTLTLVQKMIALYLILNANYQDGIWTERKKGLQVKIKRGQVVISPQKIADEWFKFDKEVTRQVVRTTLDKLERLDFLTKQTTNDYTLINIVNYRVYQEKENEDNQATNQALTKHQPSTNQALTTIKELKELKELKESNKNIRPKPAPSDLDFEMANLLYDWRLKVYPKTKKPKFEKWANDFRLLREVDGALPKDLKYIIEWSQKDSFWKGNIRSAASFREQYEALYVKAEEDFKKKTGSKENTKKLDKQRLRERLENEEN